MDYAGAASGKGMSTKACEHWDRWQPWDASEYTTGGGGEYCFRLWEKGVERLMYCSTLLIL